MLKNLWLIWCRTVDHRIGKTDDDEPNIPILTIKQAQFSLIIRSFIIIINFFLLPEVNISNQKRFKCSFINEK